MPKYVTVKKAKEKSFEAYKTSAKTSKTPTKLKIRNGSQVSWTLMGFLLILIDQT